ncbi:MAG: acyltransferase family protein, partial [bacterium]
MSERISFLDSAKAVGVIMVVGFHSFDRAGISLASVHNLAQTSATATLWFAVTTISVPVFFLVDGYLFANKITKTDTLDYKSYVLNSARRLLMPWLIFNVGYTAFRAAFEYAGYFSQNEIIGNAPGI